MEKQYLVDPRLIVDILDNDPEWGERSAKLIDSYSEHLLVLAPISYLALGPAFMGMRTMQDEFLANLGITVAQKTPLDVMHAAYKAWCAYQQENPKAKGIGSVFDSLYVGAHALLYDGFLTRQGDLYRKYYQTLNIIEP